MIKAPATGIAGEPLELAEHVEDLALAHALDALHLPVVVVLAAHHPAEAVTGPNQLDETVFKDVPFDRTESLPGRATLSLVRVAADHGAQTHAAGCDEAGVGIDVPELHRPAGVGEGAFHLDDLGREGSTFGGVDAVGDEGVLPPFERDPFVVAARGWQGATHLGQPLRRLKPTAQGDLSLVERGTGRGRIRSQTHVGGPEGLFLGNMKREVVAIEPFGEGHDCGHAGILCDRWRGPQRGGVAVRYPLAAMSNEATSAGATPASPSPSPSPAAGAAPAAAPTAAGPLPNIAYDLFAKLDLRVATIVSAEPHPNADKLLKIRLDDGTPQGRQVCAGIKAWYDPATLVGKQVVIVANLEPRQLRGEISQGMILAASDLREGAVAPPPGSKPSSKPGDEERDVVVLTVQRPVKAGSKVS